MTRFRRSLLCLMLLGLSAVFAVYPVYADPTAPTPASGDATTNQPQQNDLSYGIDGVVQSADGAIPTTVAGSGSVEALIGNLIQIGLSIIGIVFFGLLLYAGVSWMLARGNTEKVEASKQTIEGAIIGIILIIGAYAITNFIFTSLNAQ